MHVVRECVCACGGGGGGGGGGIHARVCTSDDGASAQVIIMVHVRAVHSPGNKGLALRHHP
jgi:hypothetical protein